MASVTTTEAGLLSVAQVRGRYCYDCRPTDQLFQALPFLPIEGDQLKLGMIDAATTGLASFAGAVAAGAAINTTMPAISSRTFGFSHITGEMPVDVLIPGVYGNKEDVVQALLNIKVDAVRDVFKNLLVNGTGASNQFKGVRDLCQDYGQAIGADNGNANGGTVQKGEVEKLLALLHPRVTNDATYLVMHPNAYKHLLKNNYQYEEVVRIEGVGNVPVLAGVAVLLDEFISIAETVGTSNDCTSIYAVILGEDVGLCGIYPASAKGREIQVRGPVVKDAADTMWYHVSWDAGIAVFNKCSIARLSGVKQAN